MAKQLPSLLSCHGIEGDSRPAVVLREVIVDEVHARPGLEFQLVHLLLSRLKGDNRAMILQPVLNLIVLTELSHEFRECMTCLRNPLALREFFPAQDIESLILHW